RLIECFAPHRPGPGPGLRSEDTGDPQHLDIFRMLRPNRHILSQLSGVAMSQSHPSGMTRRQAIELLGLTAAASAVPFDAFGQGPTFPKGAIIRALQRDYMPEELSGGATLFHEHMSLGPDFNQKFFAASAAVRAANGDAPAGRGGAAGGGRAAGPPPAGGGAARA